MFKDSKGQKVQSFAKPPFLPETMNTSLSIAILIPILMLSSVLLVLKEQEMRGFERSSVQVRIIITLNISQVMIFRQYLPHWKKCSPCRRWEARWGEVISLIYCSNLFLVLSLVPIMPQPILCKNQIYKNNFNQIYYSCNANLSLFDWHHLYLLWRKKKLKTSLKWCLHINSQQYYNVWWY